MPGGQVRDSGESGEIYSTHYKIIHRHYCNQLNLKELWMTATFRSVKRKQILFFIYCGIVLLFLLSGNRYSKVLESGCIIHCQNVPSCAYQETGFSSTPGISKQKCGLGLPLALLLALLGLLSTTGVRQLVFDEWLKLTTDIASFESLISVKNNYYQGKFQEVWSQFLMCIKKET